MDGATAAVPARAVWCAAVVVQRAVRNWLRIRGAGVHVPDCWEELVVQPGPPPEPATASGMSGGSSATPVGASGRLAP
eukprot:5597879-Alexandrium_andersonii.AAC.1